MCADQDADLAAPVWKPVVMQAKHRTPCNVCHLSISPGNAIYPWGNYTGYMHLSCALKQAEDAGIELQPPVCKHWSRRGYCLYQEKCFYRHPSEALPCLTVPAPLTQPQSHSNAAQRKANRGVGKRNLVRNAFRASVFRRFLIDTFGRETLCTGSGVLDVAGGKGELSFELVNLNSIASTVVEPRALQLWRQHKWMLKGYYHRNANFQTYVDVPHQDFVSGQRTTTEPPHLRMVFDAAVVNNFFEPAKQQSASFPHTDQAEYEADVAAQTATGILAQQPDRSREVTQSAVPSGMQNGSALQGVPLSSQLSCDTATHDANTCTASCMHQHLPAESDHLEPAEPAAGVSTNSSVLPANVPESCSTTPGSCQQVNSTPRQSNLEPAACTHSSCGQSITSCNSADPHTQRSAHCQACQQPGSGSDAKQNSCICRQSDAQQAEWSSVLQRSMQLAKSIKWTHKGLQHEHEDGANWSDTEAAEDLAAQSTSNSADEAVLQSQEELRDGLTDITDVQQAWDTIQHCSVIVGMHPDQAAEPIINFAQQTQRPFAMVPCCVYPAEFPHRRLPDGTWVRKYEQLIEYLQSRSSCIKVATLPFEGRNQVVYCTSWMDKV